MLIFNQHMTLYHICTLITVLSFIDEAITPAIEANSETSTHTYQGVNITMFDSATEKNDCKSWNKTVFENDTLCWKVTVDKVLTNFSETVQVEMKDVFSNVIFNEEISYMIHGEKNKEEYGYYCESKKDGFFIFFFKRVNSKDSNATIQASLTNLNEEYKTSNELFLPTVKSKDSNTSFEVFQESKAQEDNWKIIVIIVLACMNGILICLLLYSVRKCKQQAAHINQLTSKYDLLLNEKSTNDSNDIYTDDIEMLAQRRKDKKSSNEQKSINVRALLDEEPKGNSSTQGFFLN